LNTGRPASADVTRRKADYCPRCGAPTESRTFDGRERVVCTDCREPVFQQPVPTGWVAVLDGDRGLVIQRGSGEDRGTWSTPGGFLEVGESPREGAARELREETGLRVDPAALELVRSGWTMPDPDDPDQGSLVSVCFAVESGRTEGEPEASDEVDGARFRAFEDVLASDDPVRSVALRRFEAAFDRLRGETRFDDR
jgi:ADP-ribose pyrophosphatase YjhB (NUDIX family)